MNQSIIKGEHFFRMGMEARQNCEFEAAIDYFSRSISEADWVSGPYLNRGAVLQIVERFLEARDDYLKALEIEISDPSDSHDEVVQMAKSNLASIQLFCAYNDQDGDTLRNLVRDDGIEYSSKRFSEVICGKLENDRENVRHFALDELRELFQLGGDALKFALASEIDTADYLSAERVGWNEGLQHDAFVFLKNILCCLSRTPELMLEFRTSVLDHMMKSYRLGRYEGFG